MDLSQIKCGELLFSVHCWKEARRLMDHRSYTRNLSCEIKTRKMFRVEVHSYPWTLRYPQFKCMMFQIFTSLSIMRSISDMSRMER